MNGQKQELWRKVTKERFCDPEKRMDFVLFFDVRDGNPNGDPDAGNLPRMDPETGQGIVTDVCIKRKIRDYLYMVHERPIYIQSEASLNSLYFKAANEIAEYKPKEDAAENDQKANDKKSVEALLTVLKDDKFKKLIDSHEASDEGEPQDLRDSEQLVPFRDWLSTIDVEGMEFDAERSELIYLGEVKSAKDFKALLKQDEFEYKSHEKAISKLASLLANAKKSGGTQERAAREAVKRKMCEKYDDIRLFGAVLTAGTNAGQIRGPMQMTFGRSVEPILQMDSAITRCAITKSSDWKKKQTEFGRKPWLNWAVYRQHGFYNPMLGKNTYTTKEDLARFWEALACMFRNSDSASKGEMTMHDILVFVHDHPQGSCPSHLLFNKVTCEPFADTVSLSDKNISIIKRDGFDKYYKIGIDEPDIKPERPLKKLWEL